MEVGKLKSAGPLTIFYFILDSITPDQPNPQRLQHYFVITHLDSYVEAYNFLCRSLCTPPTDAAMRKWWNVYGKVFGTVSFDSFCRSIQTLPIKHFHLETSEAEARGYASQSFTRTDANESRRVSPPRLRGGPSSSLGGPLHAAEAVLPATSLLGHSGPVKESNMLMYPTRDSEDATLQLHRLRAELHEVQGQLRVEQSKQKVNGLGDAERTALMYKLESAQKELEAEKLRSKESGEKLRQQIIALQERMDKLLSQHEDTVAAMGAAERQHVANVETEFVKRETELTQEFEIAVREREKRLGKATNKIDSLEQQLEQTRRELESFRDDNARLTSTLMTLKTEREQEEQQFKRIRLQCETLESQRSSLERDASRLEDEQRRGEAEMARLRAEVARWRREAERFHHFSSSLQTELKDLDEESATTAELLRRKVLRERNASSANIRR